MMGGEVERISSETDTFIRNIEAEDFGAMLLRFKNGAVGIVEGDRKSTRLNSSDVRKSRMPASA